MQDLFAMTSQYTQHAVLEVPVTHQDENSYFAGSNMPNPPIQPKLDVVYVTGTNAPNPPPKLGVVYVVGSNAPNPPPKPS